MQNIIKPKDYNWEKYYKKAEQATSNSWKIITEFLSGFEFDLSVVLDFACGRGRIAECFSKDAGHIICCDVSRAAIEYCRKRFSDCNPYCTFDYIVNENEKIPVNSSSVTFLYSWDSMVHFDLKDIELYFGEFQRILKNGGYGLIHHSNYGSPQEEKNHKNWNENPHWRSNVNAFDIKRICEENGLFIVKQKLLDWGRKELDCITLFEKRSDNKQKMEFISAPSPLDLLD